MDDLILVEQKDHVKIITLNRPEASNAISSHLAKDLHKVLDDARFDMETRCIIITGKGRSFCAGADLKERRSYTEEERGRRIQEMNELVTSLFEKIETLEIPVIAAVNGFALGGGCELAICCDIRIASEDCLFGFPEIDLGSYPGAGAPTMLPRLIDPATAKLLLFTGRRISSKTAMEYHMVQQIVPQEQVMDTAMTLAEEIAQHAPIALRELKKAITFGLTTTPDLSRKISIWLRKSIDVSEDYQEGLRARAEKRKPVFTGK
ncbi:MAG: enoyl-CoA hydratase/isomerase family protein [Clostridiales bacterium]|nr:enoyl-CoA hydratase/isomerase family protein [Clostridiales bacterium]